MQRNTTAMSRYPFFSIPALQNSGSIILIECSFNLVQQTAVSAQQLSISLDTVRYPRNFGDLAASQQEDKKSLSHKGEFTVKHIDSRHDSRSILS